MSDKAQLVERLFQAENPRELHDWHKREGYYVAACQVSAEDVPGLIDLVRRWTDQDWPGDEPGLDVDDETTQLLPVTAWRTLGELKAESAVEPLIELLCALSDDEQDDWACEELPQVLGKIGEVSLLPLVELAANRAKPEIVRSIAVSGLAAVAEYHPETRDRIIPRLTEMMASAANGLIEFNTAVMTALVDLQAAEAAEPIERAFANDLLDVGMMGDWEDVRRILGVEGLGLAMPKHPHSSIETFRKQMGVGIFSEVPLFVMGEFDDGAARNYFQRAADTFSKSREAEQIIERHGSLGWFQDLLIFGINYRGETVDAMKRGSIEEFVFEYVPRNVTTDASAAAAIIDELTGFWQHLDRVYELPEAKAIVAWLKTDGLTGRLKAALSDTSNFGMAKSMMMAGRSAGYNASWGASNLPSSGASRKTRVGRNEPCPCGSGKKYKKCCARDMM